MTSRVRIRSSRANGALSRGPKTTAGKLRAAGNRCTHGFYSTRTVLKNESPDEFDLLLHSYIATLQPQNDPERIAVHLMAAARWGILRTHTLETRMLDEAESAVDPAIHHPNARRSAAWFNMQDPHFYNLFRIRTRYEMQLARALKMFAAARRQVTQAQTPASNPLNKIFILINTLAKSVTYKQKTSATPKLEPKIRTPFPPQNRPASPQIRVNSCSFVAEPLTTLFRDFCAINGLQL